MSYLPCNAPVLMDGVRKRSAVQVLQGDSPKQSPRKVGDCFAHSVRSQRHNETMSDLKPTRILAIETSCDETASAIIENGRALLASTVASQMDIHARYGGVFPEVASRQHVLSIIPVVEQTLVQSNLTLKDIDALSVTRGPGLAGSLVVGMNMAKGLA